MQLQLLKLLYRQTSKIRIILKQLHKYSGHFVFWPGYESAVEQWIKECVGCQQRNPPQPHPKAPLGTIVAENPFQKIAWGLFQ